MRKEILLSELVEIEDLIGEFGFICDKIATGINNDFVAQETLIILIM